ncbi:MAG: hypothetical protein N2606_02670 [Candidatus Omnitrophica bacterium]|nr:hypothetical protein [Candidatus Omnitrophota bacterium]
MKQRRRVKCSIVLVVSLMVIELSNGFGAEQKKFTPVSNTSSQSIPTPQVPTSERIPRDTIVNISDEPQIRNFSVIPSALFIAGSPQLVVPTRNVVLRWAVEPGSGGSRISSITISKASGAGPNINVRTSDLIGTYSLEIPSSISVGTIVYTLVATNEKARTATKSVQLNIRRLNISIPDVRLNPASVVVGHNCEIQMAIINNSLTLPGFNIYVLGTREDSSRTRNPYVSLINHTLNLGANRINTPIRHGLYSGEGALIVEVEYQGQIIASRRIALERRTTEAYSIGSIR